MSLWIFYEKNKHFDNSSSGHFNPLNNFIIGINNPPNLQSSNYPHIFSHTKAICDKNNFCQDYEIHCENKEIIGIRFTGAAVQFSPA